MKHTQLKLCVVTLAIIAAVSACKAVPTAIKSNPSTNDTTGKDVTDQPLTNPLSLTDNASYYQSSQGGELENGCEGWQTLMKTGESIFASRCDAKRLERLGLFADAANRFNANEVASRRIIDTGTYIMIDYEDEKTQALYGITSNNAEAYFILNTKKEYIFYRAVGTRDQLKQLGFFVDALLAANDSVDQSLKIVITSDQLNLAEDKSNGAQYLVGKTPEEKTVALVIDKNGIFIGRRTQP
jgi:hypothetical protein